MIGVAPAAAQDDDKRVLLYTGTTGFRHADAINNGRAGRRGRARAARATSSTARTATTTAAAPNNCDNAAKNPRIFTPQNLANYDAILLFNTSAAWAGGGRPGPLWDAAQRQAIIQFVQQGGGIAANHNASDMAAGVVSWDWWDGAERVRRRLADEGPRRDEPEQPRRRPGRGQPSPLHPRPARHLPLRRRALQLRAQRARHAPRAGHAGRAHLHAGQPDGPGPPDLVVQALRRRQRHGRHRRGQAVQRRPHLGLRHGPLRLLLHRQRRRQRARQADRRRRPLGAGEGKKSDCSGTVWSSFKRTILVDNINGPIGLDTAPDGKVYWSEIGPNQGFNSEGYVKVHDPQGAPGNKTTVATIQTRADHGNSEDGVLGMALEPGFDLSDPDKRDLFVYYSPRNPAWPTTGASDRRRLQPDQPLHARP